MEVMYLQLHNWNKNTVYSFSIPALTWMILILHIHILKGIVEWKTKFAGSLNVALLVGIDRDSPQTDYAIAVRLMHSNSWGDEKRELQRFTALFIAKHLLASAGILAVLASLCSIQLKWPTLHQDYCVAWNEIVPRSEA